MSKKLPLVINYADRRILLEAIASYWPWAKKNSHEEIRYGIAYFLRSGEQVDASGNDEPSRDKALRFLDKHFKPTRFSGQRCTVCIHYGAEDCYNDHNCTSFNHHKGFKRKEES